MEDLLTNQTLSRKERLAALRGQRLKNKTEAVVNNEQKTESVVEPRAALRDTEEAEAVSELPSYQISNSETVELLASKEQEKIFANFNDKAIIAASGSTETHLKPNKVNVNEDLKRDIQSYTDLADDKTRIAVQKIVQERYLAQT